ncbi:DUF6351 family protein [Jiangella aurantiaca]|uniref:DUF6351 family protein n=1 Tax=Jiangella aurantiaca TaxID=2530373 RepID=UPI0013A5C4AE|nr:DUF6351 family protein [Jiangella aurantiaca]
MRRPSLAAVCAGALAATVLTPVTPPVAEAAALTAAECTGHLAVGATVAASSTYAAHYAAGNAVDGECSESSRWLSAAGDETPTLTIDFGEPTEIGTVYVYSGSGWPTPYAGTVLVDFTVEAYTDDAWIEVGAVTGNTDAVVAVAADGGVLASKVRLVITGKSQHSLDVARVYEVAVRAPGEGPPMPAPEATDDFYTLEQDTALPVEAPGLLANDTSAGGRALTASLVAPPARGTVVVEPDGSFVYTPEASYVGVDTFTYVVSDGERSSAATATLTVEAAPDLAGPDELEISAVSTRADTVTGGDVLLRIGVPADVPPDRLTVRLNQKQDVTAAFGATDERQLVGLVSNLELGENQIEVLADVPDRPRAALTLVNHPQEGPVLSGPHQQPFVCETASFTMPVVGGTLGEPLDENCTIEPRVDYFYRTTTGTYRRWVAGATAYPSDLARTTTSLGVDVPFIVRMETTSANRAVVQTTILHDPLVEPEPAPTAQPAGWNGRAIFTLGGGCAGGWYRSGSSTGTVTNDFLLGRGFALMSSSLNVFGNNCNDVLAAESAMMTKETFVERYGPVDHTIGYGCSGGSYQAHQIADNYPGIFDGVVVGCSFPEVGFATVSFLTDARLLETYFTRNATVEWTQEQKRAASGFATYAMVSAMSRGAARIDPRQNCDIVPAALRYHPEDNPAGVRCGVFDHAVNVYGTDSATGFARRPLDNVGIQYGLDALNDGAITPEQFLDLNERIGGLDADANAVPERTEGDLRAIRTAYRTGRLTNGGDGLADIPIIDYRAYYDDVSWGDIHVRYHTFSMRERLLKANGTAANHVSLLEDARYGLFSTDSPLVRHAVVQMDHWLTNLAGLPEARRSRIEQIEDARPAALREGCRTRDQQPAFIAQELDRDPASRCEQLYPTAAFPREVAGESVAADVIKCRLALPRRDDYDVDWSDEQWARLLETFDLGVCDYSKPGVGQRDPSETWQRF